MSNAASALTHRIEGEGKKLVLERTFDAPRSLVFEVFTKEEHLIRWYSPYGWDTPYSKLDFRVGGQWHYCMKCTDESQEYYGMESWGLTVYHKIVEPEKIVFVDSFSNPEGTIVEEMPTTKATITFIDQDGRTKIVSASEYATADALKYVVDMGMLEGVSQTWNKLADLLVELQA